MPGPQCLTYIAAARVSSSRARALTATVLAMVLDDAIEQGLLVRNVARLVKVGRSSPAEMSTWTAGEAAAFLGHVSDDRLFLACA